MLNEEATVGVRIVTTDVNSGAATTQVSRNLAQMNTSADMLFQQQMARERQIESMLMAHGIRPSPGSGSLTGKQLGSLGMTEAELASLGMGGSGRAGGNQYERVLAGRMAGLGPVANLMGFSGPMIGIGAAAMGLGEGAKIVGDLIGDYREQQKAIADLNQAYASVGLTYDKAKDSIENWIEGNAKYIDNVNSAREGFAKLTRAGVDQQNITLAMNDALNLAALKGISLSDAIQLVLLGAEGNARGLKDLGIQVKDYQDLTASGAKAQEQVTAANLEAQDADIKLTESRLTARDADIRVSDAHIRLKTAIDNYGAGSSQAKLAQDALTIATDNATKAHENVQVAADASAKAHDKASAAQDIMANKVQAQGKYFDELSHRTKDGADSFDALKQSQDLLKKDFDKLATDTGPALEAALLRLVGVLDFVVNKIDLLFHNDGHFAGTGMNKHWVPAGQADPEVLIPRSGGVWNTGSGGSGRYRGGI